MGSGRRMKRKQRGDIELTQAKDQPKRDERAAKKRKTAAINKAAPVKRKPAKKAAAVDSDDEYNEFDADELVGVDAIEEDSVVDSDEDAPKDFMFSDDEDDGDEEGTAEERLTAANIAGLSRKLDAQMEEERAAAEAELQEAAIQTNVQEDILGPDGEDEKPMALLAPDLQLLRQRINDVVRVLGDFSNLAESGRSRADYTAQVLKDICAYYEYSPFLAEKLWNLVS